MRRLLSILLVALVVSGSSGVVSAQSNTSAVNNSTTEKTPTTTATPSDGQSTDDGRDVTVEDLWTVFKDSEKAKKPNENRIVKQIGPHLYVTMEKWDADQNLVEVTVRARITTRVTITDSTGVFAGDNRGAKRAVTIPRGTSTLVLPATPSDEDPEYQAISVDPGDGWVYGLESKGSPESGSDTLNKLISIKIALGAIGLFLLGTVIRIGYKVYRKQETGAPESMDGTTIEASRVGVKDDE